jgi:hypothetical protein
MINQSAKLQVLTVRKSISKAKQYLENNNFKAATQEYTSILIEIGLESHPAAELRMEKVNIVQHLIPPAPLYISTKKIVQIYLGRSAAWFGATYYWRSYEDASQALALEPQNRWAILRVGHCLLRMRFFHAAVDIFRRGLVIHRDDKKLKEGFQQALEGLRVNWHKYLPNLNGKNIGLTSTSTLSSTLPMPQDVTPNDDASSNSTVISKEQDNTKLVTSFTTAMEKKMSAEESAEIAADIAAAAADKRLEMCEQRYIEKLKKFGMILDIKDLAQQEARWWSIHGSEFRDQVAASRDIDHSVAKLTKVLLRYKVSLTALFILYLTKLNESDEELSLLESIENRHKVVLLEKQKIIKEQQLSNKVAVTIQALARGYIQRLRLQYSKKKSASTKASQKCKGLQYTQRHRQNLSLPVKKDEQKSAVFSERHSAIPAVKFTGKFAYPTPPSHSTSSLSISPRRAKQLKDASTIAVPLPTKISHGISQDMTSDQAIRLACECKLIENEQQDMDVFFELLKKFQLERGIDDPTERNRKRAILLAREGEGESPEPKSKDADKSSLIPPTILFPKFCELVARLVLRKSPSGKRVLTEDQINARKKKLKKLALIDRKKQELEYMKQDRPPNISERLSRGLDRMLLTIGTRLVGTSMTNYRWIPVQERDYVKSALKPMLPELRGIYLYLRKTSRCINFIGMVDFLKFLIQIDFIDTTRFTLETAARCFVNVTYFVGNVHLDLIDFDSFVEVLVCCADVVTNSGGMMALSARVSHFMKELLSKYERQCLRVF